MNALSQPLVSIVTPVYNEAAHLAECIESVLAQTYQNWDYTIVNNCSTDVTLDIARQYAARDARIRVLNNQEFLSVVPNHNLAFRQISAAAKYCKVVLGDDWIFPECLELMVAVAERHPSIGLVSAYALEDCKVAWTGLAYPSTLVSGREICRRHLLEGVYAFGSATTVLYRADLVRSRASFFNENNLHADTEACFAILKTSDFGFVHQVLSFTRVRPQSLSTASFRFQTHFAGTLQVLTAYAPDYLDPREYEFYLEKHLSEYYRYLGKLLLTGSDTSVWDYHKSQLNKAGVGFSRARLAKGTVAVLFRAAMHPGVILERLWKGRDARGLADKDGNHDSESTNTLRSRDARDEIARFNL